MEFPEAFFDSTQRHPEAGFNAVVGNPPYDVLSEKETGKDLAQLRAFLESQAAYKPSFRGKNNLYKLFICRVLDLLAEGGRLGFITPMAVLGDDQAADLRREILGRAAFTSVDSFPQKDDPEKRIFHEAKLSTVVFTLMKTENAAARAEPFTIRVHPQNSVREDSPSLRLASADIPQYDPSNFTIASCSQADWDLAIRIVSSGRMQRLKEFVEFFQGEVNETNERAKGNLLPVGKDGKLVTRGASICLYVTRPASQGEDLYLNVERFLAGKDRRMLDRARAAVAQGDFEAAFAALGPGLAQPPFSRAVRDVIVDLVSRIIAIEAARGEIPRAARSALAPAAQPLQDFIDRLLYALAGLTDDEVRGLEDRLARML